MMNMTSYYDFSGLKFGYPLSLSINSFDRHIFSRQNSLELSYVLQGEYQIVTEKLTSKLSKGELVMIAPGDIHLISHKKDGVILTIHIDFDRMTSALSGNSNEAFSTMIVTNQAYDQLKNKISWILILIRQENYNLYTLNAYMMDILSIASQVSFSMSSLPLQDEAHKNYMQAILYKMKWGKIERQAAFSEEAYGSGTPLNMRILYRKKGIRKIAQKEKIFQENFV